MTKNDLQEIREGLARLLSRVQAMEDHCKELADLLLCRMDYANDVEESAWLRQEQQWEINELEYANTLQAIRTSTNPKGWTHV